MLVYVIKRLALALVVLVGLMIGTFLIVHLVPGDPALLVLGPHATPQAIAQVHRSLGLDKPFFDQFGLYFVHTVEGHFGQSFSLGLPVATAIGQRIGPSAALISYSFVLSLLIGVPLAVAGAMRPNGWLDNVLRIATTFTFAMPGFWLGLMLALIFGLELHVFPVSGYQTGAGGILKSLFLPALTMGLPLATVVVRTLRSALLEVLGSDYIDAARSRGFSEARIITRHALRNASMNTLTVLAVNVGFLIGTTLVVEQVFQIPGLGSLVYAAVEKRDFPVIQTVALLAGAVVVVVSLAADLTQAFLDPRVRLAGR